MDQTSVLPPQPPIKSRISPIVALIIVVIVALLAWWLLSLRSNSYKVKNHTTAVQGQIVSGFPSEGVPIKEATITSSESVSARSGKSNIVTDKVSYTTSVPVMTLFKIYPDVLRKNNWTITGSSGDRVTAGMLFASKGTDSLTVSMKSADASTTQVRVSYLRTLSPQ